MVTGAWSLALDDVTTSGCPRPQGRCGAVVADAVVAGRLPAALREEGPPQLDGELAGHTVDRDGVDLLGALARVVGAELGAWRSGACYSWSSSPPLPLLLSSSRVSSVSSSPGFRVMPSISLGVGHDVFLLLAE